jgi:hypothetical protein
LRDARDLDLDLDLDGVLFSLYAWYASRRAEVTP